jgi:hypothetical protein
MSSVDLANFNSQFVKSLQSVGLNKNDVDMKIAKALDNSKTAETRNKVMVGIYKKIIENPSLAKADKFGSLLTEVTSSKYDMEKLNN